MSTSRLGIARSVVFSTLAFLGGLQSAGAADHRYALSMLHFNIQYVAGGLQGFLQTDDPTLDLTADQVEDTIVVQSFEPVLDMLGAHPTWGADIELQGYMLDVMGARHPAVLDKLRALALSGQIEVVSFHYSDQLFLAFPREDWVRSEKLCRDAFERWQIPRAKAVFCQEGQAGPGMAAAMAGSGYQTLVFPKNLWSFQHGDGERQPLYTFGDIEMVTSQGVKWTNGVDNIDVNWWFVDDGELLATGGADPYVQEIFKKDPAAIAKYETNLQQLETNGYEITTVSKYVEAIRPIVTKTTPPPLLDGTWQPTTTSGIFRWLGGHGLWWKDERDNDVRTLGAMAHRELVAAETMAQKAGLNVDDEIAAGFRLLVLGQVTDASGINPFRGEIEYGIAHCTEALRIARDIIRRGKEALAAKSVVVKSKTGEVIVDPPESIALTESAAPFQLVVSSGDRESAVKWEKMPNGHYRTTLHFGPGDERRIEVTFPGTKDDIVYTPGLATTPVHVPRDGFVFPYFDLGLSDGLIGLGQQGFVITDQATVHSAARITLDSGNVMFHDDTAPGGEAFDWVFYVVQGSETDAVSVAETLNVWPEVRR